MKWFEEIFVDTAGEDQLLQLDEFEKALRTSGVRLQDDSYIVELLCSGHH